MSVPVQFAARGMIGKPLYFLKCTYITSRLATGSESFNA